MMPFFAGVGAVLLVEGGLLAILVYSVWKRTLKW
ncbi:hypothetical protein IWY39_002571 [Sphingobium sp. JAI105]|nr:hypothetical protein [Sphingobium sp. JAI105]MBG6118767.1 hypothetical protein [Sphingobium sp. JAI105]